MAHNFQDELLDELLLLLGPLVAAGQTRQARRELFRVLGWELESIPGLPLTEVDAALDAASAAHEALSALGAAVPETFADLAKLLAAATKVAEALGALSRLFPGGQGPAGLAQLPAEVLNALLVEYLRWRRPRLYALGVLLSFIRSEVVPPIIGSDGAVQRQPVQRERIDFHQLIQLLKSPVETLETEYGLQGGLTDPAATADRLFPRMALLLRELGVIAVYGVQPDSGVDFGAYGDAVASRSLHVFFPLVASQSPLRGAGVTATLDSELGLVLAPVGELAFEQQFRRLLVSLSAVIGIDGIALNSGGVVLPAGTGSFSVRPRLDARIMPSPDETDLPDATVFRIGSNSGTRLELGDFRVSLEAGLDNAGHEHGFTIAADQAALVLGAGDGDGFLQSFLPAQSRFEFNFAFGWSSRRGLHLAGSGGLETRLPLNLALGPLQIEGLTLGIFVASSDGAAEQDGVTMEVSTTLRVELGPVAATAERVGLAAELSFPEAGGSLGPVDADLTFKPPTGVGIQVNAGPVTGGGFLFVDADAGRYAGALELKIYSVSVKAFGVIDTRLPDGGEGFSFVIVISAEFTPIQLGLGFTLLGVGGLLGINRRLDGEALRNAVRDGHLENVLFPTNVAVRAPEIIRDLTALFPPTEGRYVFGPLAKIGWGTPTLIRADLGIVLELPGPILSILGEVHCQLPTADAPLVSLHLTVAGQLNFPEKTFELFAALRDSQIAGFTVRGQMAMRLRWGERPVFALAVGGFHPAFTPPPRFPALQPMTVDLGRNGNPGIMLTGFFAITSNTAQVGGTLALRASGSGVTLEASLTVKAIFVFSPFSFEAEIDARVRVSFKGYGIGVRLHGTLSGPSPWRVKGAVCVSVLWWDACLRFDKSFGGGQPVQLPEIDAFFGTEKALGAAEDIPGLEDAVKDPRSWEPVVPGGVFAVVSLAQAVDEDPPFDPMGGLSVRQKVVPLETGPLVISRFGVARAALPRAFTRTRATITSGSSPVQLVETGRLRDNFAPGQFFEMDAHHKLSAPSFEEHVAGYSFAVNDNDALTGSVGDKEVTYRTRVVDSRPAPPPPITLDPYLLPEGHLEGMLGRSAAGLFGVGRKGDTRYVDPTRPDRFGFRPPRYLAADKTTLLRQTGVVPATTKLSALLTFERHLTANPLARDALQVVAEQEALP